MAIIHVLLLKFKPDASHTPVEDMCRQLLELKEKCVHPETNTPYIRRAVGGRDMSPQGLQNGMTHVFVMEFDNESDWKYYLEQDPAHTEVSKKLVEIMGGVQIVDFTI